MVGSKTQLLCPVGGMCYKRRSEKPEMAQPELVKAKANAVAAPVNAGGAAREAGGEPELAMNYCPRCSARLAARSCKLLCPDCGYYMSCSDFY